MAAWLKARPMRMVSSVIRSLLLFALGGALLTFALEGVARSEAPASASKTSSTGGASVRTTSAGIPIPEGFEPVKPGEVITEGVDASRLVVIAYAAFALGFIGYLVHLGRTQNQLTEELRSLHQRLDAVEREK